MTILGLFLNNEMRTGANRRYLELMESLALNGNKVFVIMNSYLEYTPTAFIRIDIAITYRRRSFPPASFLFCKEIKRNFSFLHSVLSTHNINTIDWIHIHGDMHLKTALFLKNEFNTKLFFAYRCNDISRARIMRKFGSLSFREYASSFIFNFLNKKREHQVAKHADLVTFQNAADRDDFIKRTNSSIKKTVIIPGNIGLPRFKEEYKNKNTSTSVRHIVYVGTVSISKGLGYLLEAISELKKRGFTDLQLSVLGTVHDEKATLKVLEDLCIEDIVTFEGYTLPFSFLVTCDLMVYPTLYDAFPDTILEALHVGCPVIASSVGGIPDLLGNHELMFESGNYIEIANKIERCIRDSDYYTHIRALCSQRADVFRFDWPSRFIEAMITHSLGDIHK